MQDHGIQRRDRFAHSRTEHVVTVHERVRFEGIGLRRALDPGKRAVDPLDGGKTIIGHRTNLCVMYMLNKWVALG